MLLKGIYMNNLALEKSLISHHYQRSMINRFSKDIARGDVRHWGEMADTRRYQRYLRCAAVAGAM
jgi:hypothetical protein